MRGDGSGAMRTHLDMLWALAGWTFRGHDPLAARGRSHPGC